MVLEIIAYGLGNVNTDGKYEISYTFFTICSNIGCVCSDAAAPDPAFEASVPLEAVKEGKTSVELSSHYGYEGNALNA